MGDTSSCVSQNLEWAAEYSVHWLGDVTFEFGTNQVEITQPTRPVIETGESTEQRGLRIDKKTQRNPKKSSKTPVCASQSSYADN